MEPQCCLCGTDQELSYCAVCKKYFCKPCKAKYPARVLAMFTEAYKKLVAKYVEQA